jgi:hypothetical protein
MGVKKFDLACPRITIILRTRFGTATGVFPPFTPHTFSQGVHIHTVRGKPATQVYLAVVNTDILRGTPFPAPIVVHLAVTGQALGVVIAGLQVLQLARVIPIALPVIGAGIRVLGAQYGRTGTQPVGNIACHAQAIAGSVAAHAVHTMATFAGISVVVVPGTILSKDHVWQAFPVRIRPSFQVAELVFQTIRIRGTS